MRRGSVMAPAHLREHGVPAVSLRRNGRSVWILPPETRRSFDFAGVGEPWYRGAPVPGVLTETADKRSAGGCESGR